MEASLQTVLFVDDDESALRTLTSSLIRNHSKFDCVLAQTEQEALESYSKHSPAVCVLDLEIEPSKGPNSGLELLSKLALLNPKVKILILTGHGEDQYGIEALKRGATSFLAKPVDILHLKALIEDGLSFASLNKRNQDLEEQLISSIPSVGLFTKNESMKKVLGELKFAASTPQSLLLLGETGTGKGILAGAIHQLAHPNRPFIRAQPSFGNFDLIQSELFGHEKGSFTGAATDRKGLLEEADQGTLFLDEIDNLPHETQVMLLHAVQEGVFRRIGSSKERKSKFRLIAASNKSLEEFKASVRADLYHRLSHQLIIIPPLRERTEDIDSLCFSLIQDLGSKERISVSSISIAALNRLKSYSWPGNVRELKAVTEQAMYRARFSGRAIVEPEDLFFHESDSSDARVSGFRAQVDQFERSLLLAALKQTEGNISEAARILELERSNLRKMLKRLAIVVKE